MPKITDIENQKKNKNRVNVYLDGEFAFGLEMLTVLKLGLKIGQEVSEQDLKEAVLDSEKAVALEKGMNYIARGRKTTKQVRDYISGKGYDLEITNYVIEKLKYYGYVDDVSYASDYAKQNFSSKGSKRIKQELIQKGISLTQAEKYSLQDDDEARENASKLAQKYMKNKQADLKTLQKLQRYLVSRGYDFDIVNSVVRLFRSNDGDAEQC